MKRREFITLLGSAAAALPLGARAQQPAMPVIGVLSSGSLNAYEGLLAAFRHGLKEASFLEGLNVAIESRGADGQFDRLPRLAADLVDHGATVIVTTGRASTLAAKAATSTIPLVFLSPDDPVKFGLVAALNRPGGNATGVSLLASDLVAKRLGVMRQLVPTAAPLAVLMNPASPEAEPQMIVAQEAALSTGQQIHFVNAATESDIDSAFASLVQHRPAALVVSTDAFFVSRREQIVALAARSAIPAIYDRREFAAAGGLISYGTHYADAYRQLGDYAGKILKGAKPADLPVQQVTRFELVINLRTAKTLRLEIPAMLLALADEVIE
jgi:putative ABC transport system substrate-binding protein